MSEYLAQYAAAVAVALVFATSLGELATELYAPITDMVASLNRGGH